MIEAGDKGEILDGGDEDDEDSRPADCDCGLWNVESGCIDLPCWPCYREGFETPASGDESDHPQ